MNTDDQVNSLSMSKNAAHRTAVSPAAEKTQKHIDRVQYLLQQVAASEIIRRGQVHDLSKFSSAELGPLEEIEGLPPAPFGSPEYDERLKLLKPMLDHHYAHNSHHPEHYPDGVAGMDLFDLIEMFFDWKAASERGGDDAMGISHSVKRFGIEPQLASILRNTATRLGYSFS